MCTVIGIICINGWECCRMYTCTYAYHVCIVYLQSCHAATCREWPVLVLAPVHQTHVTTRYETPLVCLHASTVPEEGRSVHQTLKLQAYMHAHIKRYAQLVCS